MSETTVPACASQDQFASLATGRIPWFPSITPEQAASVYAAYVAFVEGDDDDGSGVEEFVGDAAEFGAYAEYAAEYPDSDSPDPEAAQAKAVQAAQANAEAKAAEAEAEALAAADKTLRAVVTSYRKSESAYRAGLLEAGRLAHEYALQRLALGHSRDAVIQTLDGELGRVSRTKVDANRLIRAYQAYALLAVPVLEAAEAEAKSGDKAAVKAAKERKAAVESVPYWFYRDAYCQLLQRVDAGKATERWELLAGMEEEAAALYLDCTVKALDKAAVEGRVRELQAAYATRQREQESKAAADAKRAREEADAKAAAEAAANRAACEEAARAQKEARDAKDAQEKAAAEQKAKEAEAKAKAAAEADAKAAAEAAQKAKEQQQAEAKAAAAAKAEEKAAKQAEAARLTPEERKATKQAEAEQRKQAHRETEQAENLLKGKGKATEATAKDWAEMTVAFILEHSEPEMVLEHILTAMKGELSKKGQSAVDAALIVLRRKDSTAPTAIAAANVAVANQPGNGQLVTAN